MTAGATEELRDRLTRLHLVGTGEAPEPMDVRRFRRQWWDGAARVPCVVVDLDGARCRLVQTGGQVVALPATGWRARRAIRRLRRRATVDPRLLALAQKRPDPYAVQVLPVTVVRQRSDDLPWGRPTRPRPRFGAPRLVVHIEQGDDEVRCGGTNCAALVPIPPPGRLIDESGCPLCGRAALPATQHMPTARRVAASL